MAATIQPYSSYGCGSVYKRFHIRDSRVHGAGVTLPLHGRYKAVTLRSCNVDPCIRTRISRGFQNCAQIDLNQHARKTIRQKPQIALPSTCRVPASTLQNSWNLRDRWRCPNLLYTYTDPHPYSTLYYLRPHFELDNVEVDNVDRTD